MIKKIALILVGLAFLTGCEERTELGARAIIQAAAINFDEKGYVVNALLFSSGGSGLIDASEENVIRTDGRGETLVQALNDVSLSDGRAVYMSDIKLVVFGAGYEQSNLAEAMNTLYYDMGCGLDTLLACADEPSAVTELRFTEGVTSAEKLSELIENASRAGLAPKTTLLDALCSVESEKAFLLPYLSVEENGSMTSKDDGLSAVPKGAKSVVGGRLCEYLSPQETAGALLVSGENDKLTLSFFDGENERSCKAYRIKVKRLDNGETEVSARFRALNGASLTERDKNTALERLCEIVKLGL